MVDIKETELSGVYIIEPKVFGDNRGWFTETYSKRDLEAAGIFADFVQDNRSYSSKAGVIRGLHFQRNPMCQAKLLSCQRGKIMDVAVDLRKSSPTYKKWISAILSEENHLQIFIPRGFAHGFVTLTDDVEITYKCDNYYSPEHEGGIRFDDPELGIDWGIDSPILSEKDSIAPYLADLDLDF